MAQIQTNVELPKKAARDPEKAHTVSKIFPNQAFGYLKIVVERPLRLNFAVTDERIKNFTDSSYFINLATSKKRKDSAAMAKEIAAGEALQQAILKVLAGLKPDFVGGRVIKNRDGFEAQLKKAFTDDANLTDTANWMPP